MPDDVTVVAQDWFNVPVCLLTLVASARRMVMYDHRTHGLLTRRVGTDLMSHAHLLAGSPLRTA